MTPSEVLDRIAKLNVWRRGDERAPHKPLLILYALGQLAAKAPRRMTFSRVAPILTSLLREYGPPRQSYHPEHPFWYLRNDGLWELSETTHLKQRKARTTPLKSELIEHEITGGFPADVAEAFEHNPSLIHQAAQQLLNAHFPESLHAEILAACGLDFTVQPTDRKRLASFRLEVLQAYNSACAFCGFSAHLDNAPLALEAAHIHWHALGGPDSINNGLACCTLHHRAFDRGAIGIDEQHRILISNRLVESGSSHHFLELQSQPIRKPNRTAALPQSEFLTWHRREVFRSPARDY